MAKGKKTGGRTAGTPNKDNPLKGYIKAHSTDYFTKKIPRDTVIAMITAQLTASKEGGKDTANGIGSTINMFFDEIPEDGLTQFEIDQLMLSPENRVMSELRLLNKSVADLKSVDANINTHNITLTIEDRLRELCEEDDD